MTSALGTCVVYAAHDDGSIELPPSTSHAGVPGARRRVAQRQSSFGQMLLRHALTQVLSRPPQLTRSCPRCGSSCHGPQSAEGLSCNVSHCGGLTAVAVAPQAHCVGIDIARHGEGGPGLHEVATGSPAPQSSPEDGGVQAWVVREAAAKCLRRGLREPLSTLRVIRSPAPTSHAITSPAVPGATVFILGLDLPDPYVGALGSRVLPTLPAPVRWLTPAALRTTPC